MHAQRSPSPSEQAAAHVFRHEGARLRATLLRMLGSSRLPLVEDVVQDALVLALRVWRQSGVPDNPGAWLTTAAKRKALDALRRERTHDQALVALASWAANQQPPQPQVENQTNQENHPSSLHDSELALLFACAHPALPEQARLPLVLHLGASFGIPEIARALLLSHEAASQRVVRAKRAWREQRLSVCVPQSGELPARLDTVLSCLYLMLNEGHTAHQSDSLVRLDLLHECERLLSLLLQDSRTNAPRVHALFALALFTTARASSRFAAGPLNTSPGMLLLHEQDRTQWDASRIRLGFTHLAHAASGTTLSRWHIEAAIAAVHARARTFEETAWAEILSLYDVLVTLTPNPVVLFNRSLALAMVQGPAQGLAALALLSPETQQALATYPPFHAARGELLARTSDTAHALTHLQEALRLTHAPSERAFLQARLVSMTAPTSP
jgi:RNA polymerase sigma-70 factor (ECF subfamily)